jgi:tyrosinase
MDWGKYAMDPLHSPIFDGSDTSFGGDGSYVKHDPVGIPSNDTPNITIPTANGGGCITKGPFVNFTANMGPCFPSLKYIEPNPSPDCTGYNPRCLRRDISQWTSSRWSKDSDTAALLLNYPDPAAWIYRFQGDFPNGYMGVHTAGHFTWGGDPGGDFMNSPADPVFWLHHSNVDRIFWIWQNLDLTNRLFAVGGTHTVFNQPPSANTTLDEYLDMGVLAPALTIRNVSNTMDGPFCYIYA